MLYPQNGDSIVTIDSVTSLHPVYTVHHNSGVLSELMVLSVRVINVWNSLPADRVDFSSFAAFKQTIEQIDFSQFLFGYDN